MDILLVDDSRVMRQLVRRTLRQAGYELGQVVEAENGKDALTKLANWRPELVLSDWNMPEMTGIELLTSLRSNGNKVPLGFVTSESTPTIRQLASGSGALFLLTKPFTPEDFRFTLSAAGIKPTAQMSGEGGAALQTNQFTEKGLSTMIGRLVNQPITITTGPKIVPAVTPCLSMTWISDEGALVYAGFCELSAAAYLGTAIGLRPVGAVKEVLTSKVFPESLQGDVREVFNVLSRAFNDAGSVHVRLGEVSMPPSPPLKAALALDAAAQGRRDYLINVAGYGSGKVSIVSPNPKFIIEEGG